MKTPLISVVLPIYNIESYLDRCMKAVLNQTYSNLEILMVDDGSPDNCPQICDRYAEQDSRVRAARRSATAMRSRTPASGLSTRRTAASPTPAITALPARAANTSPASIPTTTWIPTMSNISTD